MTTIKFYLMNDNDKKELSTYTINDNWNLFDDRMGSSNKKCVICHMSDKTCTGHYGLLDLGIEIAHPLFSKKTDERMKYMLIPKIRLNEETEWPDNLSRLYKKLIDLVKRSAGVNKITSVVKEIFGSEKSTGIIELLSGKEGIFRKICFGKRVNGSARSVITGDPTISIDEVLIPKIIADDLFLKCKIENDEDYYIDKNKKLDKVDCYPGIDCLRRIKDGDLVFLNRQPTLSYGSLLVFRAKIRRDNIKTFGIHPNVTTTFNADFDGDEMNIFVFPYSEDLEKCRIVNFPECINDIQDFKVLKKLSVENLDLYGLTVSLDDLINKNYSEDTGLYQMIESKSKGSKKNVEQMMYTVGKQYLNGVEIGKCKSSYTDGLNQNEFFIHQKSAREGVVSTGVSTSSTGYINRKGCKIMADVVVDEYRGQKVVRDNFGIIGIAASHTYEGRIGIKAMQSVLKKATQSSLSMFHHAGELTADSILSRPSVKNVLDLDNDVASMKANIKYYSDNVVQELVGKKFKDFVISFALSEFVDLSSDLPENVWRGYENIQNYDNFVRFYLDPEHFSKLNYTLESICQIVFDEYQYYTSPDFMGIIDVEISKNIINDFMEAKLNGSDDIKEAIVVDSSIYTVGSSLSTICKLESVDRTTVFSYDIKDVEKIFGIEAARQLIIKLLDDDQYPDVIANFMTRSGNAKPFNKSTLKVYNRGFISELTFERVRDTIINSILDEPEDNLTSIYSKIWAGII